MTSPLCSMNSLSSLLYQLLTTSSLLFLPIPKTAQCPRENCDNGRAFFYQIQIRSADEPMTTFYKVCCPSSSNGLLLVPRSSEQTYPVDYYQYRQKG